MQKYPDTNWHECAQVIAGKPGKGVYDVEVNHMVEWGRSDARIIEDAFQVKLPESVHLFYRHITEAVFLWRKAYHFLSPDAVVAWEREYRQLTEAEDLPVRLIRFCKTDGDSIAFRFNPVSRNWSIVFAAYYDSTEQIQNALWDGGSVTEEIDQLLGLLMQQDGLLYPEERCEVERVEKTISDNR